jgi:hypothetical protein
MCLWCCWKDLAMGCICISCKIMSYVAPTLHYNKFALGPMAQPTIVFILYVLRWNNHAILQSKQLENISSLVIKCILNLVANSFQTYALNECPISQ